VIKKDIMSLTEKLKKELQAICDEKNISYSESATKAELVALIEAYVEPVEEIVDNAPEAVEEVAEEPVEEKEGFTAYYKSKGVWKKLGTFPTRKLALSRVRKRGRVEYKIE
jgi:hypothetical protein